MTDRGDARMAVSPRPRRASFGRGLIFAGVLVPVLAGTSACGELPAQARDDVEYTLSFENAVHHEARIVARFTGVPAGPLEIRMSRTSPGRYALHEFAKNVYDVRATDGSGRELTPERPDLHQWTVSGHDGTVRFEYTLYADRRDGTYAAVGPDGAMLNIPATLVWARGLEDRGARLTFDLPVGAGWSVASQLVPTADTHVFTAPDLAYLIDSPVLIGSLDVREWTESTGGRVDTIRVALAHLGTEEAAESFRVQVEAVVKESAAVFGDMPAFDHGTYTFLSSYLPWASGDGMEHRNSTVLTSSGRLPENAVGLLGTVAHEFFHVWNIERIRPATLEPFDLEAANVSRELWFGEGFTSYYDDLVLTRAGIVDVPGFGRRMAGLINQVQQSPGRRLRSPVEMSMQAPFVDAAVSVDPQNRRNTFISYYTWGAAVGLALDLAIRTEFPERTLDDVMRRMWEVHGKPFRTYRVDDVEAAVAHVTSEAFASGFFSAHVTGSDVPDYATLLAAGGFDLRKASPGEPTLGTESFSYSDEGARVTSNVSVWSPLYAAGIERGDVLQSVNGSPVTSRAGLRASLAGESPGSTVGVTVATRLGVVDRDVVLIEIPTVVVVPAEETGELSPGAAEFRGRWLASRVP